MLDDSHVAWPDNSQSLAPEAMLLWTLKTYRILDTFNRSRHTALGVLHLGLHLVLGFTCLVACLATCPISLVLHIVHLLAGPVLAICSTLFDLSTKIISILLCFVLSTLTLQKKSQACSGFLRPIMSMPYP